MCTIHVYVYIRDIINSTADLSEDVPVTPQKRQKMWKPLARTAAKNPFEVVNQGTDRYHPLLGRPLTLHPCLLYHLSPVQKYY